MRVLPYITALALTAVTATAALAQTPAPAAAAPAKPIVKTTCADYIALNETVKPKFIYSAVGHSKKGNKEAVFEEESIDKIKPQLDEFCAVNLTKSAYEKVIASSMATDPANAAHHAHPAKHAK